MHILVTGAAGFVGSAVAQHLVTRGHHVVGLSHNKRPALTVERRSGDILDLSSLREAVVGVDAVCHLAGLVLVRESFQDPLAYFQVNTTGTINLLQAMESQSARAGRPLRIVFASTCAVYGPPTGLPLAEDHILAPVSPYGASKLAAEAAVACQVATGKVGSVILRSFGIAGAVNGRGDGQMSRIIPRIVAVAAGRFGCLQAEGDGTAVREYLHVSDFAHACVLALEACEPGTNRVYNAGSGIRTSLHDIVLATEQVTGCSVPVSWGPPRPEPDVVLVDSSRIRAELGWQPSRSNLADIISDAWQALSVADKQHGVSE